MKKIFAVSILSMGAFLQISCTQGSSSSSSSSLTALDSSAGNGDCVTVNEAKSKLLSQASVLSAGAPVARQVVCPDPSSDPIPGVNCQNPPYDGDSSLPACPTPTPTPTPSPSPSPSPTPTPSPSPSPSPSPAPSGLPVETYCAPAQSYSNGSDLTQATSLLLTVKDSAGNTICSVTQGIRDALLENRLVDFSSCTAMTGNSYSITIIDPSANPPFNIPNITTSVGNLLYYADNPDDHAAMQIARANASSPWTVVDALNNNNVTTYGLILSNGQCENTGDPLVIDTAQTASQSVALGLSSPEQGILFDILGVNSYPAAHTPKRISWLRNHNYMFVVLPDASGKVTGVDQMFGNNNLGPDNKFASNGFLALAKYDSNQDGKIDASDAIFSQLRLWSDDNFDGVSQPGELHSLAEMGITEIDLNYDNHFHEKDSYGNEIKYKSVAKYKDGTLHLVFDLWFSLKAN